MLMATSIAALPCEVCSGLMSQRTGPFELRLSTGKSRYRIGEPIPIVVTLLNSGSQTMLVDLSSPRSQIALHLDAPKFNSFHRDFPASKSHRVLIPAGSRRKFPERYLQQWGDLLTAPGRYKAQVSYDKVDSNTITFVVVRR